MIMYTGTANYKDIPVKMTTILPFKSHEKENDLPDTALLIPAVNITENEEEYRIVSASPGLQREDFNISIADAVLTIAAKSEAHTVSCTNDRCEYDFTNWTRAFALPADADTLFASAAYQNGELIIHIPRSNTNENQAKVTIYVY